METTLVLELLFKDEAGKATKISVPKPKDNLTAQQAKDAVDAIVAADIFADESGDPYAVAQGARYVRRSVEELYEQV
ncbi:DUF2922 domain-containing protein [Aerococcaceae bacterium DSM 111176]|nr:DUF2922 domain-containing protein [Aerococcaceae bacterium DSM 111176]